jgi:hypothetical protein
MAGFSAPASRPRRGVGAPSPSGPPLGVLQPADPLERLLGLATSCLDLAPEPIGG